ncbi:phage tail tape measure C-terminal domain-containing protein [Asticcacaulis sp. EMRT-3]|uniref:phage tail tape measure C-terminal domain-containing protein n=1 Tax=Asticcacaulis sp. EMRT-3 TaxID=3040349 RepID=UPI0024AEA40B|nr:phage tail tape measure C-terminal domain-containing protein [Asticcacaulis sp. EMRT-3]MDI7775379.1 phage tail tape measure C-terminal domain-containing protein [Asticcacaulis sp. EMRT-3]
MSDPFSETTALGGMDSRVAETAAALSSLKAPASDAADAIDQAFSKAGDSLAKSLARAASDGKISLSELASALITAVDQAMGGGNSGSGLSAAISQAVSSFSGARADGGPVSAGGGYLVGERGPEVFRPSTGGTIEAAGTAGPNVSVNVMVTGGAQALVRSEAQVAAALNRAARMGVR